MKYLTFTVSLYIAAAAATYIHNADWILQARHQSSRLNRRGIIRAQHAREQQSKTKQTGRGLMQESPKRSQTPSETKQFRPPEPGRQPQETRPPLHGNRANNPRLTLEADGPAGMTTKRGNELSNFKEVPSGEYDRQMVEHPTRVIGLVRADTNPREGRPRTLKATAQGQGVSARVMVAQGGTGNIRAESDRGTEVRTIHGNDNMGSITASSRRPGGAKVTAIATPPGLVSVHAENEPNFGDL